MVRTDVAFVTALVVSPQDLQDAGLTVAIAVGSLGEVTVGEVLDVTDVAKAMRSQCLRTTLATLLLGSAFREPEHRVRQLLG